MISRNHELTGFAVTTVAAVGAGASPWGALLLGLLGSFAADWPDIDSPRARITNLLRWFPYWIDFPVDKKTGEYKTRTRKRGKGKAATKVTRIAWEVRWFPSRPVHRGLCRLSALIWDRCSTPADRKDTVGSWGPAFRVHRGFCHSVWFAGLLGGLVYWLALPLGQAPDVLGLLGAHALVPVPGMLAGAITVGMLTHLLGDCCTDFGLSPFAPAIKWKGRRYPRMAVLPEPMRFKVNKWVELKVISPICTVLAVAGAVAAFSGPVGLLDALGQFVGGLWRGLA